MSAAEGRCVGPSRPGRGRGRPWGKRDAAGAPRGRGAGRRAPTSARDARCVRSERLRDRRRPRGRREEAEAAGADGPEASGTPGAAAGSAEAAADPRAVWVDGAVGEPQVVGPVGSVWVTGAGGGQDGASYRRARGCGRKGRPGSMRHESILELWLKVQAIRAAAGFGEGSPVQLHPVPAGEGPVDRGVPGLASWVETSRGGLTGPWVKRQAVAVPRVPGVSAAAVSLGAVCERVPGVCGRGQAAGLLPGGVPAMVPYLLRRGQAAGWPEAAEFPRAEERGWGGAPGLGGRGQSLQVPGAPGPEAVCGDTPGSWCWGQAARVPDAAGGPSSVEEEARAGPLGGWPSEQAIEGMGFGGAPGTWGPGQPVGVPCAVEEEVVCGGDPGFGERGQAVWVETGSGGAPGSWAPAGAPGLWSVEQGMAVRTALGRETGYVSVPAVWGAQQPMGAAVAVPGALGGQVSYGATPFLWDRQRALGAPGVVVGDTGCGGVVSLWDRRQALGERETLLPTVLGAPGPVGQEASHGYVSCLCQRRQAVGPPEAEGMPGAAVLPRHRCGAVGFEREPGGLPAAMWVPGPVCCSGSSRCGLSLCEGVHTAAVPVAPEGPWSVASAAFRGLWERGQAGGGPGVPRLAGQETGFGGVPRPWGRRQNAGIPAAAMVPVAPRTPRPVREESSPGGVAVLWGERELVRAPAEMPVTGGVPTVAGAPGPMMADASCGDVLGGWGQRPGTEVPPAAGAAGPVDGLWGRASGPVPEAARAPLPLGVLAAVGVPTEGRVPAAVWVTGGAGEEAAVAAPGLPASRTPPAEGAGALGEEGGSTQAVGVPLARGCGTRSWSCLRPPAEESHCGDPGGPSAAPRPSGGMDPGRPAPACVHLAPGVPLDGRSDPSQPQTQNQLRFNRTVPAHSGNLAARYSCPEAIRIEKLTHRCGERSPGPGAGPAASASGAASFSAASEERLRHAVRLARRDVRRRRLRERAGQQRLGSERSAPPGGGRPGPRAPARDAGGRDECGRGAACSGAEVPPAAAPPGPPGRPAAEPGPPPPAGPSGRHSLPGVRRLREELAACIRKMEEVMREDGREGALEPADEQRAHVRRQELGVRGARMLYSLQRQVREIQEELDKLSPHRIKHTEKSWATSRLAAAHRGAVRALQVFVTWFADRGEQPLPARCRELGSLLRQLSLCSAELDADSCVAQVVADILRQIEALESLLEKKLSPRKVKKCFPEVRSRLPLGGPGALERWQGPSPKSERRPFPAKEIFPQETRRPSPANKLLADKCQPGAAPAATQRSGNLLGVRGREVLQGAPSAPDHSESVPAEPGAGAGAGARAGAAARRPGTGSVVPRKKEAPVGLQQGPHRAEHGQPPQPRGRSRVQRTTVSSRLKRSQQPVRDRRAPWVPPHPTSPPASPKCAAWLKGKPGPRDATDDKCARQDVTPEDGPLAGAVTSEAVRLAWLDAEVHKTLKELDGLRAAGADGAPGQSDCAAQLADKVEKSVLGRLKPLLVKAQRVSSSLEADVPKERPPADRATVWPADEGAPEAAGPGSLDGTALRREAPASEAPAPGPGGRDSPFLESMMLRMEEMEKYQETVRQRYNEIVFADPHLWLQGRRDEPTSPAVGERPPPPPPVRVPGSPARTVPAASIVLGRPCNGNSLDASVDADEESERREAPLPPPPEESPQQKGCIALPVPLDIRRSILDYRSRFEQHLRVMAQEAVGAFNPWLMAESFSDELVDEALDAVAAELEDLGEDCAEAVFTSEFLKAAA